MPGEGAAEPGAGTGAGAGGEVFGILGVELSGMPMPAPGITVELPGCGSTSPGASLGVGFGGCSAGVAWAGTVGAAVGDTLCT